MDEKKAEMRDMVKKSLSRERGSIIKRLGAESRESRAALNGIKQEQKARKAIGSAIQEWGGVLKEISLKD